MSLKKKLGLGVASAALGLSLIGGGTYAYFSDTVETTNTFATGTLDLSINPEYVIRAENIKPGDIMPRVFELTNGGSLDISRVDLQTEYNVDYGDKYVGGDLGEHILVHFLTNVDKNGLKNIVLGPNNVIKSMTLAELRDSGSIPDAVANHYDWLRGTGEDAGLERGDSDDFIVVFEFVDNGNQNTFQDAELTLYWSFEAHQTAGTFK
ncbi:TasA family protein [Sutcliffiella horikoshii]|uniref:TasA family protein n=1 Tax=Sutcliffiella horikoshii TaxID=79883 RepID=UPI003CEAFA4B